MNEKAFLATYDSKQFDIPLLSVDAVLFTYHNNALKVLLVERANHPDMGKLQDASLDDTVNRKLAEKTGVKPPYIEQLNSVGNNARDKRGWSVTICYSALIAHQICEAKINSVSDAQWVSIDTLDGMNLAFDHRQLIESGQQRLKQKIQKKSFRRRIAMANLLIDTGEKLTDRGRPASLYRLKETTSEFTFIRNLEC